MFEEMITELDSKVDLLIDKNIQYCREVERLQSLLDEANSKYYALEKSNKPLSSELKPLSDSAEKLFMHIKNACNGE